MGLANTTPCEPREVRFNLGHNHLRMREAEEKFCIVSTGGLVHGSLRKHPLFTAIAGFNSGKNRLL